MTRAKRLTLCLSMGLVALPADSKPTYNKNIAPIVFQHCASCHRPGESAPFSLLTYQDVKKHARQIAAVTKSRYMPPWLPEPGYGEFAGQRRLSADQIGVIEQWVEQGVVEGDPADLPPAPQFVEGWQLGEPDLVVKMPQPYTLVAGGSDVFRNFVIPVPIAAARYVRAVELRPGNKKIVHHANLLIDRMQASRRRDGQDRQPGFPGMDVTIESDGFDPDSHFLFWKPGTTQIEEADGLAWRLDKGTDLVLNVHLRPSGKPEVIQASIGLYFTNNAATSRPMLLQLENDGAIDIPPGKKEFVITDELKLPLDVEVLGVYPHAHYLGKVLEGFAILPDGTKRPLIRINDWDLNWQAVYRYSKPVFLPKGSTVSMRYIYDNSAENPRNPNQPPKRVVAGNQSSDEMGHFWIQVLPRMAGGAGDVKDDPRIILQEAAMRRKLLKESNSFIAHYNLGAALQARGKLDEAIRLFQEALRIEPGNATARNNLGVAFEALGKTEEAAKQFREALRLKPGYASARYNLGHSLLSQGNLEQAVSELREVVRTQPDDAGAVNELGAALAASGKFDEAIPQLRAALRIDPESLNARYNLGHSLLAQGKLDEAIALFREVLRLKPDDSDTHYDLGAALLASNQLDEAVSHFRDVLRIKPDDVEAHSSLGQALLQQGQLAQAVEQFQRAVQLKPGDADTFNNLGSALAQQGNLVSALENFERALRINPKHEVARSNLERARAQLAKNN